MSDQAQPFVGVQVSPVSFVDEGVEPVLDFICEETAANALFVVAHGYNPELIDRPEYNPGHGRAGAHRNHGGSFFTTRHEYYEGIAVGESRASGDPFSAFDVLEVTIPAARAREMDVYAYILEGAVTGGRETEVANFPRLLEVDIEGRRAILPCINHPTYREWQLALVEDIYKSYPVAGFRWGMERWGPLHQALVGETPACFCSHCQAVAREDGIDPQRILAGYRAVCRLVRDAKTQQARRETSQIELVRVLLACPEILAWENLWTQRYMSLHRELYGVAKWLAPERPFGIGLWHYFFINPLLRAEWDLHAFHDSMDFISPILYRWAEGARIKYFLDILSRCVADGYSATELWAGFSQALRLEPRSLDHVAGGLPADYVARGVRIVRDLVGDDLPVYAAVGIDVVQHGTASDMRPADAGDDVRAAFRGGADGVILARNFAEMRVDNVKGAGSALAEVRRAAS